MQPESLIQLIGSGNVTTVEQEWEQLLQVEPLSAENLLRYQPVLVELSRIGRANVAETLAWSAVEGVSSKLPVEAALNVARSFLLAAPESKELRTQTAELYRRVHGKKPGFEALVAEAGLIAGRPARRAVRTMDVCLALEAGSYLVARDEDVCARVEAMDTSEWRFEIEVDGSTESINAVALADRFRPAEANEFRVLQSFNKEELTRRMEEDPVAVVRELCVHNGGKITDSKIEEMIVPGVMTAAEWKKWWTRAKAQLKKSRDVTVSGKTPLTITAAQVPVSEEEDLLSDLRRAEDPTRQFERIHRYLIDCSLRGTTPSTAALKGCAEFLQQRADDATRKGSHGAGALWLLSRWTFDRAGSTDGQSELLDYFASAPNVESVLAAVPVDDLLILALDAITQSRPTEWRELLKSALPRLPLAACDLLAQRLRESGTPAVEFEPVFQRIVANPLSHFDALLWLWDGPADAELDAMQSSSALLTKIVRTLDGARRRDTVSKETIRKLGARARSVFSARGYERFKKSIQGMETGMAGVLRNQVASLDILGRAVRDELVEYLRPIAPQREEAPKLQNWAREDVIYVTEAGMSRKHNEIEQHVNVKMKENARAIGAAAEHGDLSENSEYKFALEERDLLRARLAQMNSEMAIAEVISPTDVPSDHVGIGSRVVFQRQTDGARQELTFLGPWDGDLERNVLNYKAPLAQAVMGKRVSDVVDLETRSGSGRYEIVEIHNGLDESLSSTPVFAEQSG